MKIIFKNQQYPEHTESGYVFNKEELIKCLQDCINGLRNDSKAAKTERHERVISFIEDFLDRINKYNIPEDNNENWMLNCSITSRGAVLEMSLLDEVESEYSEGEYGREILKTFRLISIKPNMIGIKEFAKINSVDLASVCEMIRKGRIRNARLADGEWEIREFEIFPDNDKYEKGEYLWFRTYLDGLPPEFEFLNDFDRLDIKKVSEDMYKVVLTCMYKKKRKAIISTINENQREQLEYILISHPKVKRFNDYMNNFSLAELFADSDLTAKDGGVYYFWPPDNESL